MKVFFDSSAFAKRYVREAGTDAVIGWCDAASELCLSAIAVPEIISAFCRLQRESRISALQYRHLRTLLMTDISDAAVCDLTPEVIRYAVTALEKSVLRGMDAIHVGSALAMRADLFVSADKRQVAAAAAAGVRVEQV